MQKRERADFVAQINQLELRVDALLPDPAVRILTVCEFGRISTLAAATLRSMGFAGAVALDGGMRARAEARYPTEKGAASQPSSRFQASKTP